MTPTKPVILVTGSNGQLGHALSEVATRDHEFQFVFRNRQQLDITSEEQIEEQIKLYKPRAIINTAAYTWVDAAEDHEETAHHVNAKGPENLAHACQRNHITLYHISTDYVFDGASITPYMENESCSPINIYGESKRRGEDAIRSILQQHFIIRTSWLYSTFGNNFFKTISRLAQEKPIIRVVNDQIGSPTWAGEVAKQLLILLQKSERGFRDYGTYHLANKGTASWFDFAKEIVSKQNMACQVHPISTAEYPTKATRPKMSVLDCRLWEEKVGPIPTWLDSLDACISSHTTPC